MAVIHYTRKLDFTRTRLLCGTVLIDRKSFTQRQVTQNKAEVTCKRCLAALGTEAPQLTVNVGASIIQVLQLDDEGTLQTLGMRPIPAGKGRVTFTGTAHSMNQLARWCEAQLGGGHDCPLWYQSSAKAVLTAVNKVLA